MADVILADAIEAWGRHFRRHLDDSALEKLAFVWRTVRKSEVGRRELADMDKDDARTVMLLFEEDDRNGIAELLNTVRTWAIENPVLAGAADESEPVPRVATSADSADQAAHTTAGDLLVAESESSSVLSALDTSAPAVPLAGQHDATPIVVASYTDLGSAPPPVAPAPSGDPLVGAPPPTLGEPTQAPRQAAANRIPQPLPAPLGFEEERAPIPQWMLGAGVALLLVVLLVIFLLTRGGDDTTTPDVQTETGITTQVDPGQPESIDLGTVSTDGG